MSSTIAVALISTASALLAVVITGTITLATNKIQVNAQRNLTAMNLNEERIKNNRQTRRDAYASFLNSASTVETKLSALWGKKNPPEGGSWLEFFTLLSNEMLAMKTPLSVVELEGPPSAGEAANKLYAQLQDGFTIFAHAMVEHGTILDDHESYGNLIKAMTKTRKQFIRCAQAALQ